MTRSHAWKPTSIALVSMVCVLGAWAHQASAQRTSRQARAQRDLGAEFDRIDLDACFASPDWVESSTRASLVVHPDGVWALALDGAVTEATYASMAPALRTCMEDALRATWGERIAPAPRRDEVHVRTFDFRVHHEDPTVRRAELRERIAGARSDLARCVADLPGRRLAVELRLGVDGRLEVALPRPDVNRGLCITNSLGVFMPGAAVAIRETIEAPVTPAGVAGGEGALCGWGERHRTPPPEGAVRTCAAGLMCCSAGGAAGSDSMCMRTTHCPAYP